MTPEYDDKDLEIARLKGKVEALEGELAKERAVRLTPPALNPFGLGPFVPAPMPFAPAPMPPPPQPLLPGILPWPGIVPTPIWPPSLPPPVIFGEGPSICGPNVNCCNPTTLGGEVWVGETRPSLEAYVALSQGRAIGTS